MEEFFTSALLHPKHHSSKDSYKEPAYPAKTNSVEGAETNAFVLELYLVSICLHPNWRDMLALMSVILRFVSASIAAVLFQTIITAIMLVARGNDLHTLAHFSILIC